MKLNTMNILYIEDDIIDQKAFVRLVNRDFPSVTYCIACLQSEVEQSLKEQSFDWILADQRLNNSSIMDYATILKHEKILLVSGSNKYFDDHTSEKLNVVDFFVKPLKSLDLAKYFCNLRRIEELAEGDLDFIEQMKSAIKEEITKELAMIDYTQTNQWLCSWIHKSKNKVALLNQDDLVKKANKIENKLKGNTTCTALLHDYVNAYAKLLTLL